MIVPVYDTSMGHLVQDAGIKAAKKRNPVYLMAQLEDFEVETNEGRLKGHKGDFVAYDPISGHVWPVSRGYVDQHYESF